MAGMFGVWLGAWLLAMPGAWADAGAEDLCTGLEGKKLERCEEQRRERLAKMRERTTPFPPSLIHADLSDLDASNPFDQDRFYLGTVSTGIAEFDAVINEVVRVQAAVKMARYLGELYDAGEAEKAERYAAPTLEALIALKDTKENIMARIQALQGVDPKTLLSPEALKNPAELLQAGQAVAQLGRVAAQVPGIFADIPGAIQSLKPLLKDGAFEVLVGQGAELLRSRLPGQ